jgi:hypothetical protein
MLKYFFEKEDLKMTESNNCIHKFMSKHKRNKITPSVLMKYVLALLCLGIHEFGNSMEEQKKFLFNIFNNLGIMYGFPGNYDENITLNSCVVRKVKHWWEIQDYYDTLDWSKVVDIN